MGRPRLDAESLSLRHRRVVELSQRGVPVAEIASIIGITERSVHRIRGQYLGAKKSPRRLSAADVERAEAMLADGASLAEVAHTLGCHRRSLQRRFSGRGWTHRQVVEHATLVRRLRV